MTPIDSLPDDVLLPILKFHVLEDFPTESDRAWRSLVHVCRRWRSVVFGSSGHLNLRLVCTARTPVRNALEIWPSLPLTIVYDHGVSGGVDNIIAGLERTDSVHEIFLIGVQGSESEIIFAAMQRPFPELRRLWVNLNDETRTVTFAPDSFLGGSAPRLEYLQSNNLLFPGLLNLLLSATHLVYLHLSDIPHSGYISPDTMVTALSILTSLSYLILGFASPRSCPDRESRRPPPSIRSVLSALSYFQFTGASEYLEDLVACVDAPQLSNLHIIFFNDIVFDTPQLVQFIGRTPVPREPEKAHLTFWDRGAEANFSRTSGYGLGTFRVGISCRGPDWQVSYLEQVCTSCLPPSSKLEDLYIHKEQYQQLDYWKDNIENGLWLELLRPFTAVKNLYLSEEFATRIAPALQELLGHRTTDVLPALQNIFLEGLESLGPAQEGIRQLVAARQVASRPIAVSRWANSEKEKGHHQGHYY